MPFSVKSPRKRNKNNLSCFLLAAARHAAYELYMDGSSAACQSRHTCIICCASRVQRLEKTATRAVKLLRWAFVSVLRLSLMLLHNICPAMQIPYFLSRTWCFLMDHTRSLRTRGISPRADGGVGLDFYFIFLCCMNSFLS